MTARRWMVSGCLLAALTVLVAAFAAHQPHRHDILAVPVLSKIPYMNNLFERDRKCQGDAQSLMMLVTPRIIIQEEEEAKLLGQTP